MPKRMIVALASAIALLAAPVCAGMERDPAAVARIPAQRLEAIITPRLAETKVPSVAVVVIENKRMVLNAAYGWQSPGVRATPATLYNIASLTKPITAETILRLAAAQRLSLDAPMRDWWLDPDLANDPRAALLTARIALSHRTGFPNWRAKTGLAFVHDPGTYGYSGEGYAYLATFAERRTGVPFETLAQTLVLDPLGMRNSAYTERPWFAGRIATPTDADGNPLAPQIAKRPIAADLVYATAEDYGRFLIGVLGDATTMPALAAQRRRILADMRADSCRTIPADRCPDAIGFGLGWQVVRIADETVLTHSGRDTGLFTFAFLDPDHRRGVVILTNGARGDALVVPILDGLRINPKFTAFLRARAQ